jgi:hypothetical protein
MRGVGGGGDRDKGKQKHLPDTVHVFIFLFYG